MLGDRLLSSCRLPSNAGVDACGWGRAGGVGFVRLAVARGLRHGSSGVGIATAGKSSSCFRRLSWAYSLVSFQLAWWFAARHRASRLIWPNREREDILMTQSALQSTSTSSETGSAARVEQVLVIPTRVLHDLGYFQGFQADIAKYLNHLLSPQHTSYRPRPEMEQDPNFKQLIPYVIFRYRDAEGQVFLFQYTRGGGQGEKRLHHKRSIGIGGHISTDDQQVGGEGDPYGEGLRRELAEEVLVETSYTERLAGLINDDRTEVGRVHLGIVHLFDVLEPSVRPRETELLDAGFRPVQELLQQADAFESWSAICLEAIFGSQRTAD